MKHTEKTLPVLLFALSIVLVSRPESATAFSGGGDFVGKGLAGQNYQLVGANAAGQPIAEPAAAEESGDSGGSSGGGGSGGGGGTGTSGGGGGGSGESSGVARERGTADTGDTTGSHEVTSDSGASDTDAAKPAAPTASVVPSNKPQPTAPNQALTGNVVPKPSQKRTVQTTKALGERIVNTLNYFNLVEDQTPVEPLSTLQLVGFLIDSQTSHIVQSEKRSFYFTVINDIVLFSAVAGFLVLRDRRKMHLHAAAKVHKRKSRRTATKRRAKAFASHPIATKKKTARSRKKS